MATFLDVPSTSSAPSIVSNLVPEDEQIREMRDIFDAAMATEKSKPLTPNQGFCVKLHRTDESQKAFINICHTKEIPPPNEISEAELTRILESDDPTSYRIPLSLALPHDEKDKSGKPCMAYDVIINSEFYRKVTKSELFKTFLILLAVQGVEDKYTVRLSRDDYVVLQNKKYWGTMPEHYIQDRGTVRPAPLIDEIEPPASASGSQSHSEMMAPAQIDPRVRMNRVEKPGRTLEHLVAEIKLPGVCSVEDISLDLAKDRILLRRSASGEVEVDLYLPLAVNVDSARAQFDYKAQALRIDAPVLCD